MNLQECLNKLGRGKISNLSLCQGGYVKPEHMEKVIDAINEALLRLYTAIPIKEAHKTLSIESGIDTYKLDDDMLTVTKVFDNIGRPYAINNPEEPLHIWVSGYRFIIGKLPEDVEYFDLIYRVKHKELCIEELGDEVEVPENLQGALYAYVAYLLHNDMNTKEAVENAQKYLMEYQAIIDSVIQQGTINPEAILLNAKFRDRGFV